MHGDIISMFGVADGYLDLRAAVSVSVIGIIFKMSYQRAPKQLHYVNNKYLTFTCILKKC